MTHTPAPVILHLADADETARLGSWFGQRLRAGDCLLLEGQIGAGKSHLARALIRARLGREEDVPSPTFTLVQTYQADVEIWHGDLYRLSHPDEVLELGLETPFDDAICLVEWPDRLGRHLPKGAIRATISLCDEGRDVMLDMGNRADLIAGLEQEFAVHA